MSHCYLHTASRQYIDDIYAHASHMIYLVYCRLPPIGASMLNDLGVLDTSLVMHTWLIEPIVFGCSCIICLHTMKCSLVLSYDENTCWVSYHSNDRFCIYANLICFSECLSCSFILKNSKGGTITRHIGYVKAYKMCNSIILEKLLKVTSFPLSHSHICILDGSFFHCCFLLIVYMIHILDGGPTLEMDPMDFQV